VATIDVRLDDWSEMLVKWKGTFIKDHISGDKALMSLKIESFPTLLLRWLTLKNIFITTRSKFIERL